MRRFWISLGLLIALFSVCLWNTAHITDLTDRVAERLEAAENAAAQEDWERAEEALDGAAELWEQAENCFTVVLRHGDTDEVTTGFEEVLGFLKYRDAPEFSSAVSTLTAKVEHLAEVEELNWKNLL